MQCNCVRDTTGKHGASTALCRHVVCVSFCKKTYENSRQLNKHERVVVVDKKHASGRLSCERRLVYDMRPVDGRSHHVLAGRGRIRRRSRAVPGRSRSSAQDQCQQPARCCR